MHVKVLTFRGDTAAQLYSCGACGKSYSPKVYACGELAAHRHAEQSAEKCCQPRHCEDCGVEVSSPWVACGSCREIRKLKRATHHPYSPMFAEPVYTDEISDGGWGEGYFDDVMTLLQHCEDEGLTPPAYVHKTTRRKLKLDPDSILESAVDDMHEDAFDQIEEYDEFRAFIQDWNEKQTCVTYYPDWLNIVVLDSLRLEAMMTPEVA